MNKLVKCGLAAAAIAATAEFAGAQGLVAGGGDIPAGTFFPEALSNRVQAALPTEDYLLVTMRDTEFEIRAAQLAQVQSSSPRVKSFADHMAADGARSAAVLQQAAQATGFVSTPELNADEYALLNRLKQMGGKAFDQLYLRTQFREQLVSLQVHTNYHYRGASRAVRAAASREIPITENHLSLLNSMRGLAVTWG